MQQELSDYNRVLLLKCYWKNGRLFYPHNCLNFQLFVDWLYPELQYMGRQNFPTSYRYYSHEVNRLAFILNTNPDYIISQVKKLPYDPIADRLQNTETVVFIPIDIT